MSTELQDLSNTREVMQHQIMKELALTGECFLCEDVIKKVAEKYPGVSTSHTYKGKHWFVKNNDFPYPGTRLHILIVPIRHVSRIEELTAEEFSELQEMIVWVNTTYDVGGASMFIRYGDMSYTGATLAHMHFHIFHGVAKHDGCEKIKPTLGYTK